VKNTKKPPNVVCVLPGSGEATVVVGAHFDYISAGSGAIDNWSGASMLPSLYQALAKRPRTLTFIFVGFTEEETGLEGSRHFVQQWRKQNRPAPIAMVNLDCLGLSPTRISVTTSDKQLLNHAARIARAMKLTLEGVDIGHVGMSDAMPFMQAKIPTLDVTSITQDTLSYLHSPEDTSDKIRFEHYLDTFKLVAAFLTFTDAAHAARPAAQPNPVAR
jgi:Zn-dependent M28 family amino/carboxypeptidase